jgi:hypothetical protein
VPEAGPPGLPVQHQRGARLLRGIRDGLDDRALAGERPQEPRTWILAVLHAQALRIGHLFLGGGIELEPVADDRLPDLVLHRQGC